VGSGNEAADAEINVCINAFITRKLQRFRFNAASSSNFKHQMTKTGLAAATWDSLVISHKVSLFTPSILFLEFQLAIYGAGAAHPNSYTRVLNFRLSPSVELEGLDLFRADYLPILSNYCVSQLTSQKAGQMEGYDEEMKTHAQNWIKDGADPKVENYRSMQSGLLAGSVGKCSALKTFASCAPKL